MKRKILFFVMLLGLAGLFTLQSCQDEDGKILATYGAFTDPVLVAPTDGQFLDVTGTTVVLSWSSSDAEGDPQKWDLYFGESDEPDLLASNLTTQTYTVTVEPGVEYFWYVAIEDANGIPTTSHTWSFEVVDPDAHLGMVMSWATNVEDVIGMEVSPTTVANLRLRILKEDLTAAVSSINTTGFETFGNWHTLADGKYFVATDLTATIDAGDFNAPVDIDINLDFSQRGVWEASYDFPVVMDNRFVCSTFRVYLGYVIKAGSTYTFTPQVTKPVSPLSATWYGLDNTTDFEYDSQVETYMGCSLQVTGLSFDWMSDFWGEVIIKGGSASITINTTTGAVTIPNQFYCRTKWNGAVQPDYFIQGTGTYDASGAFPTMTITYDLLQNGVSMADQDGGADPAFIAVLTQDPAGLPPKKSASTQNNPKQLVRPAR